jgi:ParB family chromosome partitioning protein
MLLDTAIPIDQKVEVPIDSLVSHPDNPRGPIVVDASLVDLAKSIGEVGIVEPIIVALPNVIVAGHRRHEAARIAGLSTVPVIFRRMGQDEQRIAMLVENIHRQGLLPYQEAVAFRKLREENNLTYAKISERTGVALQTVYDRLKIFELPPEVQEYYARGTLGMHSVGVLLKLPTSREIIRYASELAQRKITVDELKRMLLRRQEAERSRSAKEKAKASSPKYAVPIVEGRMRTFDRLRGIPGDAKVSIRDAIEAYTRACEWCGIEDDDVTCKNCAVPRFARKLGEFAKVAR